MIASSRAKIPQRVRSASRALLQSRHNSATSFSFTPTADYKAEKQSHDVDVPARPTFKDSEIYKPIVRPEDVADLFFQPKFEDILVTSLAKDCPYSGSSSYKVTSKSEVKSSNLMFANIVIEWMASFGGQVCCLAPLPQSGKPLSFISVSKTAEIDAFFNDGVFKNQASVNSFCQQFSGSGICVENLAQYLVKKCQSSADYELLMKYLSQNVEALSPMSVNDLVIMLMEDLSGDMSLERVSHFDTFFTEYLTPLYPKLPHSVDVATLDRLAYISAFSSNIPASTQILSILVNTHRVAPSKHTFELYFARYAKYAASRTSSKEDILLDLSPLKPLFFHFDLPPKVVDFLLKNVVDNSFDLSNFVKLLVKTSPQTLAECRESITEKLHHIHTSSQCSDLVKSVELMQLQKLIADCAVMQNDKQ